MNYVKASKVKSPQKRWRLCRVIYDAGESGIAIAWGIWDGEHVLAIRWNGENDYRPRGYPHTMGHPTWFILPNELNEIILSTLSSEGFWNFDSIHPRCVIEAIEALAEKHNFSFNSVPRIYKYYDDDTNFLCFRMVLGGGDKSPLGKFLDLVNKTHKGSETIKQVIITDPYIFADVGESGINGGYENLLLYLGALRLLENSKFKLLITPAPKKGNSIAFNNFSRFINGKYPSAVIGRFNANYIFHDRIFLTITEKNTFRGVFGPSLNGLGANDFVLMGEIEKDALVQLSKMFQ